uniref:Ig-like domain-containing protein n=1 Tax=Astyanax mexicanus TaxID=7994 RepID=A0A3B1ISU5_ASTMX
VNQDGTVSFRCRVVSGSQPIQLEWRDNVKVGPDGSVLTIASARPGNQGQYRCIATNAQGKTTITGVLTIKQAPKVRVTPSGPVTVRVGQSLSLECHVTGRPRPSITWEKQVGGQETVLAYTTTDAKATLQVSVMAAEDSGTYLCRAQSREGSAEEKVELRMEGGASVAMEPKATVSQTDLLAVEGQSITMHCQATGSPAPEISWSKLRAPLPWQHKTAGGTLTLTNVGRQDSGQYICNATNAVGYMEAYVQLEPHPTPPSVPDQVVARRGDTLRLQCIAHGSHPISFQWSRVGGASLSTGARSTKDGRLSITQLKVSDSGNYKCVATNHVGTSETVATVTVRGELNTSAALVHEFGNTLILCSSS